MTNTRDLNPSRGLAITYLVRLSIGSPSGGRSEIENLNVIKKIREGFLDFPYASSQAMKRALRDTLKGLGFFISPVINSSPARTVGDPTKYIDDDLFGYMDPSAKKESKAEESESEASDDSKKDTATEGEESSIEIPKQTIGTLKSPKKAIEKIKKYFSDNNQETSITKEKLQEIGITDKEIDSIIKAVTKDETASFNKMLQNLNSVRKSVISMTPLLSLSNFDDSVDFGANMLGLKAGTSPMPYETEVHRGWYRISLYIDLDRIGTGDGFIKPPLKKVGEEKASVSELLSQNLDFDFVHKIGDKKFTLIKKEYSTLDDNERYRRAKAILDSIRFLAPSGRSSNWLIDLTPKLMAAAYVKGAKTPFLESPLLDDKQKDRNVINLAAIETSKETFDDGIEDMVVGYREDLIDKPDAKKEETPKATDPSPKDNKKKNNSINITSIKDAFTTMDTWLKKHFKIEEQDKTAQESDKGA